MLRFNVEQLEDRTVPAGLTPHNHSSTPTVPPTISDHGIGNPDKPAPPLLGPPVSVDPPVIPQPLETPPPLVDPTPTDQLSPHADVPVVPLVATEPNERFVEKLYRDLLHR